VSTKEIPEPVRRFLAEHIDSVGLLEALLLLRAAPDKRWTAEELARALVTGERLADRQLNELHGHRLAVADGTGYRYAAGGEHARTVDDLAECYARRRHTVIGAIYGGGQTRGATSLADAFRLRKDDR
jgi:hypothetical protein